MIRRLAARALRAVAASFEIVEAHLGGAATACGWATDRLDDLAGVVLGCGCTASAGEECGETRIGVEGGVLSCAPCSCACHAPSSGGWLASDALVGGRQRAASWMRRATNRTVRAAGFAIHNWAQNPGRPLFRIARHLDALSGEIAGCGCIDDDAESCHGDWCECHCHGRTS